MTGMVVCGAFLAFFPNSDTPVLHFLNPTPGFTRQGLQHLGKMSLRLVCLPCIPGRQASLSHPPLPLTSVRCLHWSAAPCCFSLVQGKRLERTKQPVVPVMTWGLAGLLLEWRLSLLGVKQLLAFLYHK